MNEILGWDIRWLTMTRRWWRKIGWAIACLVGLGLLGLAYVYEIEPTWIEVNTVELTIPRLAEEFHGYRIVQISDIHADRWMNERRLGKIVQQVNHLQPDLVALTGDFITRNADIYAETLVKPLSQLTPGDRTVAVLGNHDHWSNPAVVLSALNRGHVTALQNDVVSIIRGNSMLHIAGVDDIWAKRARLRRVLRKLPSQGAAILLAHEPDFADTSAKTHRFALQLSGHSHGGQVRFPFKGAPVLPIYARKYPMGQYQVGDMIQYTNRGIGTVRPHVRFNCRPEITVLVLNAAG